MHTETRNFRQEWLILGFGLLIVAAFIAQLLYSESTENEQRERERLSAQTKIVEANLGRQLTAIASALHTIRHDLPIWQQRADGMQLANLRLRAFCDSMPGVRVLLIFDAAGTVTAANLPELVGQNFAYRAYFQEARKQADETLLHVSAPFKMVFGTWTINVSHSISGPDGKFAGLIVAGLEPEEFRTLLDSVRYADDMTIDLAHQNTQIFIHSPEHQIPPDIGLKTPSNPFVRHLESQQASNIFVDHDAAGTAQLVALQSIRPDKLNLTAGLTVAVTRQLPAVQAAWRDKVAFVGSLYLLLALLAGTGLFFSQRHRRLAWQRLAAASRAEQQALIEAQRFREALEHVSSYIYMKDREHRYLYANRATCELFGVTPEELPGSPDSRFFPAETVARLQAIDAKVLAGNQTREEVEVDHPKLGRRVYLEVKTPLYADAKSQEICGLWGISTDITERKQSEEELERLVALRTADLAVAKAAAEAANQAKTTFLATMSHELRTPLNAIIGFTNILVSKNHDPETGERLQKIEIAAHNLYQLIQRILEYTRNESAQLSLVQESFRPGEILIQVQQLVSRHASDKNLALKVEIDDSFAGHFSQCEFIGDPLRIEQVLLNLAENAVKFTEKGSITLRLDVPAGSRTAAPAATQTLRFAVSDTGIGIASADQARIFNAFEQADGSLSRRYNGSGLGLALCRQQVRLMNGEIGVNSEPGAGSTFWFTVGVELPAPPPGI